MITFEIEKLKLSVYSINRMTMAITIQVSANSVCASVKTPKWEGFCTITKRDTPTIGFYVDPGYEDYTRPLIATACAALKHYYNSSQRIYVDADASDGLWDSMGFVPNPMYDFTEDQRHLEGAGYEKFISFAALCDKIGV